MAINSLKKLSLAIVLASSLAQAAETQLDRIAVIVDDGIIMQSQLNKRLHEVSQSIRQRGGELPPADILRQQVLDRMILDELQLQVAARSGIRISDDELADSIETLARRNKMSSSQFLNQLAKDSQISIEQVRDQIRQEILLNRVRQHRVADQIQVSEQEVKNFLGSALGELQLADDYHLANILIPMSDAPTEEEVQQVQARVADIMQRIQRGEDFQQLAVRYSASENALDGGDMGWRKAAQLPPPFDTDVGSMSPGQVSEPVRTSGGVVIIKLLDRETSAINYREEVNVRHILIKPSAIRSNDESRKLAERLYQRLQQGEDFAQLARQFSEDPGSARSGGSLDWVSPDSLVPEFRDVMGNTASGQISRPFASTFGWHILQVMDRRVTDGSEELRRQQAANTLHNRKYEEELQLWLKELRDEAYVEIKP